MLRLGHLTPGSTVIPNRGSVMRSFPKNRVQYNTSSVGNTARRSTATLHVLCPAFLITCTYLPVRQSAMPHTHTYPTRTLALGDVLQVQPACSCPKYLSLQANLTPGRCSAGLGTGNWAMNTGGVNAGWKERKTWKQWLSFYLPSESIKYTLNSNNQTSG